MIHVYQETEKENEISSLSAVIGENFKQYLIIIFRLFLSLSKAENGDVSKILSPVFQNVKWDPLLGNACYPQQDSFPGSEEAGVVAGWENVIPVQPRRAAQQVACLKDLHAF